MSSRRHCAFKKKYFIYPYSHPTTKTLSCSPVWVLPKKLKLYKDNNSMPSFAWLIVEKTTNE